MTRRIPLAVLTIALAVAPSCSGHKPPSTLDTSGLDQKLSTFAFMEEGKLVTFIVDARAARIHKDSAYFPLEIAVANRALENLTLTRESFTLIDEEGHRYHVAAPRDLFESYQYLDIDRAQAELQGIVYARFANFTRYPASFNPTLSVATGVAQERVSLPKWGYMVDFIYFPVPQTGLLDRRFELHMEASELPDPVFVKFAVQ